MSNLVFGESNDKNCSENELAQNNNMQETEKTNQQKVDNSQKFGLLAMFCRGTPLLICNQL